MIAKRIPSLEYIKDILDAVKYTDQMEKLLTTFIEKKWPFKNKDIVDDDEEEGVERRKKVPKVRPHIVIGAPVEGRGNKSKAESEERSVTNNIDNHI